jgi:hypothetical protein
MSTSAAPLHPEGNGVVPAEVGREAEFYGQLLQIRDAVYAGKHPRIRLPAKVIEQVAPRPSQIAPPAKPTTNGTPNGTPNRTAPSLQLPVRPDSSLQHFSTPQKNGIFSPPVPNGSRPFSAKSASSGIDPVLLTKSDHLIKAELQLKRQQLERALKDQLDKKARVDEERELLDVENVLGSAQKLVQPVSGLSATATNSDEAESFDENSYYSSKADSWSSSEVDRNQTHPAAPLTEQRKTSLNEAQVGAHDSAQPNQASQTVIELDEDYEPTDDIDLYEPEPARAHEEADESDYSPPPADTGPSAPRRGRGRERNGVTNGYGDSASLILSLFSSHNPTPLCLLLPKEDNERDQMRSHLLPNVITFIGIWG